MPPATFYELNVRQVSSPLVRGWVERDLEIVERALEEYRRRGTIGLSVLLPEYRGLIEAGRSYTVSFSRGPRQPLIEDLANKIAEFDALLVSIHRRATLEGFTRSYGFTPETLLDILERHGVEEGVLYPLSMAPPWAYERPAFYQDILESIESMFGYLPPSPWARITEFFSRAQHYDWTLGERRWGSRVRALAEADRESVRRLMEKFSRAEDELVRIITTKSCQLELFGLRGLLERIVYPIAEGATNFEFLYALVTFYHKYLVSSIIDYAGGVAALSPSNLNPGKLGLSPRVVVRAVEPFLGSTAPITRGLEYKHAKTGYTGPRALGLLEHIVDKLRPRSAAEEYRRLVSIISEKTRTDIEAAVRFGRRLGEALDAYMREKIEAIERILRLVDYILIGGVISLIDKGLQALKPEAEAVQDMINIVLDMIETVVEEGLRRKYRELLRNYIRTHPGTVLRMQGIFWLVWAYKPEPRTPQPPMAQPL